MAESGCVPEGTKYQVLVVDDSAVVRAMVRKSLEAHGMAVIEAENAARAREILAAQQPDLIILDVVLPDASGLDLCREFRADARFRWIPVIILTAQGEAEARVTGYRYGADDYIIKPFDPEELALRTRARVQRTHRLRDEAILDPLTGSYTRKFLFERLEEEIDRHRRYGQIFSLLMCDLDDFKQVNDRLGHLAGDFVLREFAAFLRWNFRGSDIVARYGGEEFVVLLPGTPLAKAVTVAGRARDAWLERVLIEPRGEHEIRITFSAGLAEAGRHGNTSADLLASADRALYAAKAQGKNRIVVAG
ncbi:MAG: diguanylate cyclase [Bacillota bacterium]